MSREKDVDRWRKSLDVEAQWLRSSIHVSPPLSQRDQKGGLLSNENWHLIFPMEESLTHFHFQSFLREVEVSVRAEVVAQGLDFMRLSQTTLLSSLLWHYLSGCTRIRACLAVILALSQSDGMSFKKCRCFAVSVGGCDPHTVRRCWEDVHQKCHAQELHNSLHPAHYEWTI